MDPVEWSPADSEAVDSRLGLKRHSPGIIPWMASEVFGNGQRFCKFLPGQTVYTMHENKVTSFEVYLINIQLSKPTGCDIGILVTVGRIGHGVEWLPEEDCFSTKEKLLQSL